jgi:asparagine synthase (glutamine-hydrolysing)
VCGIVATLGPQAAEPGALADACRALAHRGPDGEGTWAGKAGPLVAELGHRRLAILDPTPAGAQPMTTTDGQVAVTYNGELYNYPALRTELEARGHRFTTRCDTEALLHAWREWGEELCPHLEGMFAFVLVDQGAGTVFAARDRLGVKPLYWARRAERTSFASEPKALFLADPRLEPAPDPLGIAAVLTLLWVPHPRTPFAGVEKLPPGHQVVVRDGQVRVSRWWDAVAAWADVDELVHEVAVERLGTALAASVRAQLLADVPVGVFLSGGLDSCAVLELTTRHAERVPTVGVGYDRAAQAHEFLPDDAAWARRFADRHPNVTHAQLTLDGGHWTAAEDLAWHLDDLVADPAAISMHAMSAFARPHAKVMLSGVGAEELFAGYPRYKALRSATALRALPLGVRRALAAGLGPVPAARPGPGLALRRNAAKYAETLTRPGDWFHYFTYHGPERLGRLLDSPALSQELFGWLSAREDRLAELSPLRRARLVDVTDFLPNLNLSYVDKASMAASVEVRVPIADERMVAAAAGLGRTSLVRGGVTKRALRDAARPLIPAEFIDRPKAGLGGPVRAWVATGMGHALDDRVADLAERGWVDHTEAMRVVAEHRTGRRDRALAAWAMYSLSLWAERFIDTPVGKWLP